MILPITQSKYCRPTAQYNRTRIWSSLQTSLNRLSNAPRQGANLRFKRTYQTQGPAGKQAQAMKAWTAVLIDKTDDEDDIEGLGDYRQHPDETLIPLCVSVTESDVMEIIADDTRKETAAMPSEPISNTFEHAIAGVIQVGFTSTKGRIRALISTYSMKCSFLLSTRAVWIRY